jgi:hypothetical protein
MYIITVLLCYVDNNTSHITTDYGACTAASTALCTMQLAIILLNVHFASAQVVRLSHAYVCVCDLLLLIPSIVHQVRGERQGVHI